MVLTPVIRNAPKGLKYVMIRIHNGGTTPKYKTTGYKITEKHWNKNGNVHRKNWVRTTEHRHRDINQKIDDMLTQLLNELEGKSPKKILAAGSNNSAGNQKKFLSYAKAYLRLVRNQATRVGNEQAVKKLEQYLTEQDKLYLTFNGIDKVFCKMYYNWLLEKYVHSTTNQYFGVFRTIYNDAVNDDSLAIDIKLNPFTKFKYAKNKTTNDPLSPHEFENFRYAEFKKRSHKLTQNIWLFQFANAFRVNEVLCLKWKHIKLYNEEFILDIHTSKTTMRVFRILQIPVVELLVPAIERYYPDVTPKLQNIIKNNQERIDNINELRQEQPKEITTEDVLAMLNSGYSAEEIKKQFDDLNGWKEMIKDLEREIDHTNFGKRLLLRNYILKLHNEHPNDFVWDKPQQEGFDPDRMNKEDHKAYKRCVASNHNYLKRMAKEVGIKTSMSSHVARYTASQFMLDHGTDFNAISQFLTHSNHGTTEKYVQRLGVKNKELSDYLAGYLS